MAFARQATEVARLIDGLADELGQHPIARNDAVFQGMMRRMREAAEYLRGTNKPEADQADQADKADKADQADQADQADKADNAEKAENPTAEKKTDFSYSRPHKFDEA